MTVTGIPASVGDLITCINPGSWTHGITFEVVDLDVKSPDGAHGHRCKKTIHTDPAWNPDYVVIDPATIHLLAPAGQCAGYVLRAFQMGKYVESVQAPVVVK